MTSSTVDYYVDGINPNWQYCSCITVHFSLDWLSFYALLPCAFCFALSLVLNESLVSPRSLYLSPLPCVLYRSPKVFGSPLSFTGHFNMSSCPWWLCAALLGVSWFKKNGAHIPVWPLEAELHQPDQTPPTFERPRLPGCCWELLLPVKPSPEGWRILLVRGLSGWQGFQSSQQTECFTW